MFVLRSSQNLYNIGLPLFITVLATFSVIILGMSKEYHGKYK